MLILVFIAILPQQPVVNIGKKDGINYREHSRWNSNHHFYNLLIAVPEYLFLIFLTLFASLFFGGRIFSGKPMAGLYAAALSTLIPLVGSTTGNFGCDAENKFYIRIAQIICAALYIIGAFMLLDVISRHRQIKAESDHAQIIDNVDVG